MARPRRPLPPPLTLDDVCARLEAAAAEAPAVRPDGSFVVDLEAGCRRCGVRDRVVWAAPNLCARCAREGRS